MAACRRKAGIARVVLEYVGVGLLQMYHALQLPIILFLSDLNWGSWFPGKAASLS